MWRLLLVLLGSLTCLALAADEPAVQLPPPASHTIDFAREVKPLFEASCVQCHAKGKDKGGLSLETREALLKGGDDGAAVVPGDSAASSLIKLVSTHDTDSVMPKKGTKWTADQIGVVRAWIDQGLSWDPHITFAKPESLNLRPRNVTLPNAGSSHPADRLLAVYFSNRHVEPPPVVDDRLFCRRAYLDVIGLLPTPQQLNAFLSDASANKRSER